MNFTFNHPIFAMMPADPSGAGPSPVSMLLPIVGMLAIFYFLLIRPQQKRQKEMQKMVEALRKGDRVVTASGIVGTIAGLRDDIIVLQVSDNVKIEMLKSSVTAVTAHDKD
ncbi:MAG: preprotein translocase subunit YajC [Candidatus Krumholzibacteria bacterium]|nr:preprotein translocase subunit YajC [Candidatus Krumholzibacteria bacterium]MDH5268503.1 preprotein translocase subunit YajC [Candidatus Krumholzibacteria bacterium]